jgi:hypothetical protein
LTLGINRAVFGLGVDGDPRQRQQLVDELDMLASVAR